METSPDLDALLLKAGSVCSNFSDFSLIPCDPQLIKDSRRSLIVRCRLNRPIIGISSLIFKLIKEDSARGFSDWASLYFLSEVPETKGIAPRFFDGHVEEGFFFVEDLGKGQTLQEILNGGDLADAYAALVALAGQMGRLHTSSIGREQEFEAIRRNLPDSAQLGRDAEMFLWMNNHDKLLAWFEALHCTPPPDFLAAQMRIGSIYRFPGDFLAFTHGDPAPTNNHFAPNRVSLVDFEYGGFRHALYDITAWHVLCPLPIDVLDEMRRHFQKELACAFPAARDEATFDEAWAVISAYRALAMLAWISPDVIREDRPWAEDWSARQAVFVALSRLERVAAPFPNLAPIATAAGLLVRSMQKLWPQFTDAEALLPKWRCFEA